MPHASFTVPQTVTQNLSRARSYLRKNETVAAVDALLSVLAAFDPKQVVGNIKFKTENTLKDCVDELGRDRQIADFINKVSKGTVTAIPYKPGEEAKLAAALRVIRKALEEAEATRGKNEEAKLTQRRTELWARGVALINGGESPKGKALLRRLGDEFGHESGILANIGGVLMQAGLLQEASEFLTQAVDAFPSEPASYMDLIQSYVQAGEYSKAETIYLKAIGRFGRHPTTMLNFAKMYRAWGKRDKTWEIAKQLEQIDPDNSELPEIMAWADR